jgi:alkylation response protein AidB-like acyl-CoA dehydrogenase
LPEAVLQAAQEIAALARELAPETERERRLAGDLVARLRDSGLMLAGAPREVSGLELPPGDALACAEEIATGDASAGWCVSIAATSSLLAAYLPDASRSDLFAGPHVIASGVWAPRGRARSTDGGLVVSGRWPYCSGIAHADLFFAGAIVDDAKVPSVIAIPTGELEVLDTWHTLGLRGTGSSDTAVEELFIPQERVLSLFDGPTVDRALYRFPAFGYFALSVAAAALGNARGAVGEFVELARRKVGPGASRTLAQRSATQAALAGAEASLRGARAMYYAAVAAAWDAAQAEAPVPVPLRNDLRLAATHATRTSAEVVRTLFDLAGGPAIYDDSPLQRRFRDAHTATAHFQVNAASRELQGRILLGQEADAAML